MFCLDEDLTQINIKKFNSDQKSPFTSVSFIFYSPYEYEKFEKYDDENITPVDYKLHLQGELWNNNISKIDYNDVAIDIKDYFQGYEILYDNHKKVTYGNKITDQSGWRPPYLNGNISIGKIFTVDVPFQKDVSLQHYTCFTWINSIQDLTPCETQNELNQVHREYFEYRLTSKASEVPPCRSLDKLEFSYFEYDIEEGKDPNVTISILFIDDRYREMLNIRAFDVHSLLGNIGGYVGIFIGCALLNLPDAIMKLIKIHRCVTCSKIHKLEEQMEQVL